jgi:phenol 2-monooxygenase
LAKGLLIGTRFHSAPVIRIGDGKKMQLGETLAADGRWRLMAFEGKADGASPSSSFAKLCQFLTDSPQSPLKSFTPAGSDIDSVFDVRAVFQQSHHTLAVTDLPALLFPQKGRYGLHDYEKAFCNIDEPSQDIYALRNINRELGCLVIVRPDQYIAHILPLDATNVLAAFFAGFMSE